MEVKKSPKADLERHKFVFRLIGLSIALILMITVFQLKSFSDLPTQDIVERVNPDTEVLPPVVYRSEKAVPEKKKTVEPKKVEPQKPAKRPKKLVVVNKTIIRSKLVLYAEVQLRGSIGNFHQWRYQPVFT